MDVQSQINSLNIVPSWKQKFLAISESKPVGGGIGHEFGDREKYKALPFWTKFSIWGLLFGALFYFFKGMWKKGLALIGLNIGLAVLSGMFSEGSGSGDIFVFASYALHIVAAFAQANIDYYRKVVLNENFWW